MDTFEFLLIPFRLTNVPDTFQFCMNPVFCKRLHICVLVFFGDILIYNRTWEEHIHYLEEVLHIL